MVPHHGKGVDITYTISKGSSEPANRRSLSRTYLVRSLKRKVKGKLQTKNETHDIAKGPGMRTERLIRCKVQRVLTNCSPETPKRYLTKSADPY